MISEEKMLEIFSETGAMQKGHFLLTSGKHSDLYMQCARLFVDPDVSDRLCSELARLAKKHEPEVVISPAIGGILMGFSVSKHLKCNNIFAERVDGKMELRRGFSIAPNQRVLVVEDVVTSGGTVQDVIQLVRDLGGLVVAVGVIVDRSKGAIDFGVPLESLLEMNIPSYDAKDCPICAKGLPLIKPGSREFNK